MTGDGTRAPGARGKPAEWRADFRGGDSSYASVWLLLLLFPVYRGFVEGPLAGVAALVAVGAFSVVYAAGFGLADRRPLGWSRPARCGIWVAAMLLCAAAAWPFVGALVVFFTPYLSVFCAFHLRPSHSILAVGAIIAAGVGITALYGDGAVEAFSGTTIIVPAFLLLLAQVIQRQDRAEELAHESHCRITVTPRGVVVLDDGRGMGDAAVGDGEGLAGLARRVEAMGGTFTVADGEAGGTEVSALLPAPKQPDAADAPDAQHPRGGRQDADRQDARRVGQPGPPA